MKPEKLSETKNWRVRQVIGTAAENLEGAAYLIKSYMETREWDRVMDEISICKKEIRNINKALRGIK